MKDNNIETLDFDETPEKIEMLDFDFEDKKKEEIEMLDFDIDEKVSSEIDEMLDFLDTKASNKSSIEINADESKLDEYVPSIKDFNIKSAKTRKIVKKAMVYVIILMLIGFEFFINAAGETLNNIRVYASDNYPIKIVQNEKYGYIDIYGNKIVNPKYIYGEDFVYGYAIVKNTSNMPLVIDKGGKEVIKSGKYFSLYRASDDIIASKITKNGLKYGILDSNLKTKTNFIYDSISYKDGIYTYVKGNLVGLINVSGKKIYEYKLTDKDSKDISVTPCNVTKQEYERYGVVTINGSSFIVNLEDGTEVFKATLNTITPEENNVFVEAREGGIKRYIYVENNKILLESENYNSLSIDSIESGVLKAINNSYAYEYISTKTMEKIENNITNENIYYGDEVVMYKSHSFSKKTDVINFVKNGEIYKSIPYTFDIEKPFKNGFAIVKFSDGKYGYINEDAELINDDRYLEAKEFDSTGFAIAKKEDGYGVLKKDGSALIKFNYEEIKSINDTIKLNFTKIKVAYAVKTAGLYTLYSKNGKKVDNTLYEQVEFNKDYPVIKASTESNDILITLIDMNKINLTSENEKYIANKNYIIIKNEYYNYNGKLIYMDNSKESLGE